MTDFPIETQAAIDSIINAGITTRSPGALVGVTKADGSSYFKAYGDDKSHPITLDSVMRWGSCTKMATATLVLAQVDAGNLALTDTLESQLPGTGIANASTITIDHLLQMTSGIKDYLEQDPVVQQKYFLHPLTAIDPMPYIQGYAPLFAPGTQGSYSNSNYFLLGKILEAVDLRLHPNPVRLQRSIGDIITQDFLTPLGLSHSEYPGRNNTMKPYPKGYCLNYAQAQVQGVLGPFAWLGSLFGYPATDDVEFTAANPKVANSAGALDGTIADFVKFGQALHDGALLSPAMKEFRNTSCDVTYVTYNATHSYDGPGVMYFGRGVITWGNSWLGWQGNFAGYLANVWFNVDNGTVVAVIYNYAQAPSLAAFYQIAQLLHPETLLEPYHN